MHALRFWVKFTKVGKILHRFRENCMIFSKIRELASQIETGQKTPLESAFPKPKWERSKNNPPVGVSETHISIVFLYFYTTCLFLSSILFLVKWGGRNRPHARRELNPVHVVPTHPPVTAVGHLPSRLIAGQIYPYVLILSYSYAGRRIRSKCTHILMRVDHTSLGRGHFIVQNHQPTNPKNA